MTRKTIFVYRLSLLAETADTMAKHNISGVPVLDDRDRVAGIITEKDFLGVMGALPFSPSWMWLPSA